MERALIYLQEQRENNSRGQVHNNVVARLKAVSAVITDNAGVIAGSVALNLNQDSADRRDEVSDRPSTSLEAGEFSNSAVAYFEASENAKQADAFKLIAVGSRLMQSYLLPKVKLRANNKTVELYRTSGASIPMIDAAILPDTISYTGYLEISRTQYQHVLMLADMSGLEMELLVANANIAIW